MTRPRSLPPFSRWVPGLRLAALLRGWLAPGVVACALAGCGGAVEEQITPQSGVLNFSQSALSSASVRFVNGTYGAGCQGRSGSWSQSLSASPGVMDFPALYLLANEPGCQLTLTALVADVTYQASPTLLVGPDYAAVPSAFVAIPGVTLSLAGSGTAGLVNGTGTAARFNAPRGVSVDAAGNVYVADTSNHVIRKITPAGAVTTLAGAGVAGFVNGAAATARFSSPQDLAIDGSGNVFVADTGNNRIRKITAAGVVSTLAGSGSAAFADGTGAAASFRSPRGLAWDGAGNLLVADTINHRIRRVTPAGVVTTVAGTGQQGLINGAAASARFRSPQGVAVNGAGDLVVADTGNHCLRLISGGNVTTFAGSGTAGFVEGAAATARFRSPTDVAVDTAGNVFVADQGNHRVRKVASGVVSTLAGSGTAAFASGTGAAASFNNLTGLVDDGDGNVFVADTTNHRIRRVATGAVASFFGNAKLDTWLNKLSFVVSDNPLPPEVLETGVNAHSVGGMTSTSAVSPPNYTFNPAGVVVQVDAARVVLAVSGGLTLTDGTRTGTAYVVDQGTLPPSPTFTDYDAVFQAGSAVVIAGPNPVVPGASLLSVGTSLVSGVKRTVVVKRQVSGVVAYQAIELTFNGP